MPGASNGGRSGNRNNGKKSETKQQLENLRGACPPHKKKDFDMLVKQLNGDQTKIQEKIQEWWDEPIQPEEEEKWEDVNKKSSAKPKPGFGGGGGGGGGRFRGGDRGGRAFPNSGGGGAPGRGGRAGRGRGGRGGRLGDRKFRDNNGPPHKQTKEHETAQRDESNRAESADQQPPQRVGVPKPVTNAPLPKGAWGRALAGQPVPPGPSAPASPEIQEAQTQQHPISTALQPPKKDLVLPAVDNLEVGVVTKNDPTPAGLAAEKPATRALPSGNVWATKGSAHLIQAEKPKPPASIIPVPASAVGQPMLAPMAAPSVLSKEEIPAPEPEVILPVEEPPVPEPVIEVDMSSALETGLPPAVVSGAWGSEPSKEVSPSATLIIPTSPEAVIKVSPLTTSMAPPSVPSVEEPIPPPKPQPPAPKPPRPAQTNVLNMGHWETADNDDSQNLDFGFGSFGVENDNGTGMDAAASDQGAASSTSTPPTSGAVSGASAATAVSPARPPPGLSIGGMPPMPANAVLVHELETSLENSTLNSSKPDHSVPIPQEKSITNPLPPQPATQVHMQGTGAPVLPGQQNYNQYGMGMYNQYGGAGSGFVGVHAPAVPFLAGVGVMPQQQPPKLGGTSPQPGAVPTQTLPHASGLYGHHVSAPSSGNAPDNVAGNDINAANNNAAAAGMPPGMPGMPPYNPALYYGQQPFHLGQQHGGMGYNYGYGQFGGVQGGFAYQQVMGQSGGYGAPHYGDEQLQAGPPHQGQTHSHHSGSSGGYNKNSGGGYRGRNNHHNSNQYQNQYNPQQHGGYGGQPYGMGYHNDHFNQRGGYGHNMGDPYGMQQQQPQQQPGIHAGGVGFQDDNDHHNKGRRSGNNRTNNNLQQFQAGPHGQLSGGQQPFGLQGQADESAPTATGAAGAGGWANNNQQGGWSGSTGWQGGN